MNDFIFNMLVMAHCAAQSKMFTEALNQYENGYKPKTNIFNMLTVAEANGIEPVAGVVASVLAGVKYGKIDDPVAALYDLIVALKYKSKFFAPSKDKDESNFATDALHQVYNISLDLVNEELNKGTLPNEVTEKVCELIYD